MHSMNPLMYETSSLFLKIDSAVVCEKYQDAESTFAFLSYWRNDLILTACPVNRQSNEN